MADKAVVQEVRYAIRVSEKELDVIRVGLQMIRNFGEVHDWDLAQDILADLAEEN